MSKKGTPRDQQARLLLPPLTFDRILREAKDQHATPGFQSAYRNGAIAETLRAEPVIRQLEQAIKWAELSFQAEWETAQWFNNHMPGVGQTIDYRPMPSAPAWLSAAKLALLHYHNAQNKSDTI